MPIVKLSPLLSHLVYAGLLAADSAGAIEIAAKALNVSLIHYLVNNHILSNEVIMQSFQKSLGIQLFDLSQYDASWLSAGTLDNQLIRRYQVVPLHIENNILHLAIADPTDRATLDAIAFHTGRQIKPMMVAEKELSQFIKKNFSENAVHHLELNLLNTILSNEITTLLPENTNHDEPIIKFVDQLIQHAIQQAVSDIHLEPFRDYYRIRYRLDGILYEKAELPAHLASRVNMRLKVMAKCDIAERRLPQDGRFQIESRDIRINICPTLFGEKIVLRILNANNHALHVDSLHLTEAQKNIFIEKISDPQGMILVTGPTGSGKTITLYTALNYLNSTEKNISTVEDPVEIQLPGINQVNIHPKIGLHFATVLRTLLRQDPDIIMIGEIRDTETAEIATQAALTGHLVLSTLHTTSAIEAINRLQSMGITPYNIINSLSLIIAQRLIRKLCEHCKQLEQPSSHITFLSYRAVGCKQCLQGYQGRVAIYEFLPINETIKQILLHEGNAPIADYMQQNKLPTLKQSGIEKIRQGISTIAELNRVLHSTH